MDIIDKRSSMNIIDKVIIGCKCCQISMSKNDPFAKCRACPYNHISISVQDCRSELSRDVLRVLREQSNNGWISVKYRMPSEEEVERTKFGFLCYIKGFFIMPDGFAILPYNKEAKAFWCFHTNRAIDNVTHWMPLPEPPEEAAP